VARDRLFGLGPTALHDPAVARDVIEVCGRSYRGDAMILTMSAILVRDRLHPVLVDPAPFAPCPAANEDGDVPCAPLALPTPCATVVYVRIGEDAYATYELVGGP